MQIIAIRNSTDIKDKMLKVIVNGEIYIMRYQFLSIQIPDGKSFEVKVKYLGGGSPVYTFNPQDNMVLQVSKNRRLIKTSLILFVLGVVFGVAIMYFFGNFRFISSVSIIAPLFVAIHQTIRRNKSFVIQEVSKS